MKAVGYIRVSTKSQKEKGSSLDVQEVKIREYCALKDFDLHEVIGDRGISGMSFDKRDGYKSLLEMIEKDEVDVVVVHSLSRLGRKMKDVIAFMEMLRVRGIKFYSIKESLSNDDNVGQLIVNILSSINEFEVLMTRERIRDVKRNKKERGLVYGKLSYGFDNIDGVLVKNKKEQSIIVRVKKLRTRGHSWSSIANRLNEDHIESKCGSKWYAGSLYNMMRPYLNV